jgi:NADH:ubiquinone oxidoreductase subunit 5 (subunit L)/multisubunit Na+/H+ antiporter MnhA subunit
MAVMTKSAQFPFHIWLPDTMQAPTPVSAIMHAGIINSGGFLLTRISPMIAGNLFLTDLIFTIGVITFICASFFILTQSDVKKQLAYSTMGQMGFMIMQCGLGLYAAAIFHLIAHGFFKAFLFLSAGNNLLYKEKKADHQMAKVLLSIIFTLVILAGYYFYVKTTGNSLNSNLIMAIFISITLAQILAEIFVMQFNLRNKILAIAVIALVFAMYMLLVNSTETILSNYINLNMLDSYKVIIGLTLLIVQIGIWLIPSCTNILPEKLTLWVYHLSRNKLFIEDGYRKYLLNPYRHFGDYLNKIFCQYHEVCFILLAFVASFYTYLGFSHGETFASPYNILINQVIYFVMLIAANRALNIDRLNLYLFVSQII